MVAIEKPVVQKMIAYVESYDEECCGFLFGKEEGEVRTITKWMMVRNSKEVDRHNSFEILPKDYLRAERLAEEENLNLLGVYHSHPNHAAFPSEYDRLAAQPYFSYVIISIMNKKFAEIRSWQLDDNFRFKEEELTLYNHPINTIIWQL